MTNANPLVTYEGGCHCGAVRFRVIVDKHEAVDCNCSMCKKKGFLHLIVSPEQFTLLRGTDTLTTYTFNTHTAKHTFCRICGIHPFYRPRSHPHAIDVNVRCLDGDRLSRFQIVPFDGANWEENIDKLKD
ncbi:MULTISPECIES: GFA family protein [unclassified Coleofasciculus]|uniref:GFA family protein n=1 Tax=unclassified Coleofasciculus TaxID=2692782 RepID=UPI00188168AF|nr:MULTISPECIES: GFA family protein [unclassified Coleofasciculus]MBE9127384.1 GFA family protein [Coleofasciculus sp. LEGE 07081]MBE9147350.1 GFA family protein [Coleofasciculus sp. LEGE 07092]